jgi:type VI secretion system secreted protein Hcp
MNRARRIALASIASVAAAVAIAPSAYASTDAYLRVDGVQGESVANGMTNAIDVNGFELGVANTATIGGTSGTGVAGKAAFNEITIDKYVDATSPWFFQRLTTGQNIPTMELVVRKSGATTTTTAPYLRYCITTAFVTAQKHQSGDDAPTETLTFKIGGMQESYTKQGAPNAIVASWSQILAKPFSGTDLPAFCK